MSQKSPRLQGPATALDAETPAFPPCITTGLMEPQPWPMPLSAQDALLPLTDTLIQFSFIVPSTLQQLDFLLMQTVVNVGLYLRKSVMHKIVRPSGSGCVRVYVLQAHVITLFSMPRRFS